MMQPDAAVSTWLTSRRFGVRALIHDIGRAAVPARIWRQPGPLAPDDWEKVRLHPYQTERILHRSPFLAVLAGVAGAHHERCDGSRYHRGTAAPGLTRSARLLAAADAYRTKIEPRPIVSRSLLSRPPRCSRARCVLTASCTHQRSLKATRTPRIEGPGWADGARNRCSPPLARGLQTKQMARALGISVKTADNHIQNVYSKIGVSTRAAAAVFAMQHGLVP